MGNSFFCRMVGSQVVEDHCSSLSPWHIADVGSMANERWYVICQRGHLPGSPAKRGNEQRRWAGAGQGGSSPSVRLVEQQSLPIASIAGTKQGAARASCKLPTLYFP